MSECRTGVTEGIPKPGGTVIPGAGALPGTGGGGELAAKTLPILRTVKKPVDGNRLGVIECLVTRLIMGNKKL